LKSCYQLILDVRTSAHLIVPAGTINSLFDAHRFQRNEVRSNSEADYPSSGRSPR